MISPLLISKAEKNGLNTTRRALIVTRIKLIAFGQEHLDGLILALGVFLKSFESFLKLDDKELFCVGAFDGDGTRAWKTEEDPSRALKWRATFKRQFANTGLLQSRAGSVNLEVERDAGCIWPDRKRMVVQQTDGPLSLRG